jgi:hypothetical protein
MSMVLLCESCWFERGNGKAQVYTTKVTLVQFCDMKPHFTMHRFQHQK